MKTEVVKVAIFVLLWHLEESFQLCPRHYEVSCGFVLCGLYCDIPSIPNLLGVFIMKGYRIFSSAFSASIKMYGSYLSFC
jgi:hypothetical protein